MKTKVEFYTDTATGDDCVIHISLAGSKDGIREKLLDMVKEIDSNYGKPCQGWVSSYKIDSHIITPIWGGKEY
jgi:hypothetical protein